MEEDLEETSLRQRSTAARHHHHHQRRRAKKAASLTTNYDDVFGGPPKHAVPFAGVPDDYSEVFGGVSVSCSIPFLDLPTAPMDGWASKETGNGVDYGEIFGRCDFADFAVPYEELFGRGRADEGELDMHFGSANGRSSFKSRSGPQTVDPSAFIQEYTIEDTIPYLDDANFSVASDEMPMEYNTSYSKSSRTRSKELLHTTAPVPQPQTGFTFVVEPDKPLPEHLPLVNEDTATHENSVKPNSTSAANTQTISNKEAEQPGVPFLDVADVSLLTRSANLPPPARPPPSKFLVNERHKISTIPKTDPATLNTEAEQPPLPQQEKPKSFLKSDSLPPNFDFVPNLKLDKREKPKLKSRPNTFSKSESLPPGFGSELDAMKEAMEFAQARLKSAKELHEKRREGKITELPLRKKYVKEENLDGSEVEKPRILRSISLASNFGKSREFMKVQSGVVATQGTHELEKSGKWRSDEEFHELTSIQPTKERESNVEITVTEPILERNKESMQINGLPPTEVEQTQSLNSDVNATVNLEQIGDMKYGEEMKREEKTTVGSLEILAGSQEPVIEKVPIIIQNNSNFELEKEIGDKDIETLKEYANGIPNVEDIADIEEVEAETEDNNRCTMKVETGTEDDRNRLDEEMQRQNKKEEQEKVRQGEKEMNEEKEKESAHIVEEEEGRLQQLEEEEESAYRLKDEEERACKLKEEEEMILQMERDREEKERREQERIMVEEEERLERERMKKWEEESLRERLEKEKEKEEKQRLLAEKRERDRKLEEERQEEEMREKEMLRKLEEEKERERKFAEEVEKERERVRKLEEERELERERIKKLEEERELEREKFRKLEEERELERERVKKLEEEREQERERVRQLEEERERERIEKERERNERQKIEKVMEQQKERERQKIEKEMEQQRERERQKIEKEMEQQREMERIAKEREQKEMEKKLEEEREKQRLEKEKEEREKQRRMEKEREEKEMAARLEAEKRRLERKSAEEREKMTKLQGEKAKERKTEARKSDEEREREKWMKEKERKPEGRKSDEEREKAWGRKSDEERERERGRRARKEKEIEERERDREDEEEERQREREKDRLAMERATQERAERIAIERITAARQRAVENREKEEINTRVGGEGFEKKRPKGEEEKKERDGERNAREARLRAERAAVERATAEARERAIEKAKAEAEKERDRLERLKSLNRISSQDNGHESHFKRTHSDSALSQGYGESALRHKARLERQQRTAERAAKALAEKNRRDIMAQREQAERDRIAEHLDADVRRWSSGKEGNLRALLSTLQYILGQNSGWQPIHLTEVITAADVKRAYRKATLYVHPDKLQQRGASIQQKYICEKVFDLLKEAWNKFNSEER